jgi:hypothetical protein
MKKLKGWNINIECEYKREKKDLIEQLDFLRKKGRREWFECY